MIGRHRLTVALVATAALASATAGSAQQRSSSSIWANRLRDLTVQFEAYDCIDTIDQGQHLDMRFLTSEQVDRCEHVVVEELLADDQTYVDHLWCLSIWSSIDAARARLRGAELLEGAIEEVANPIPDSARDLLRKVSTALDVATVAGGVIGRSDWNAVGDLRDAEAERYWSMWERRRSALDQMRQRWEHRKTIQPDCPPRPRPDPVPEPPPVPESKPKPRPKAEPKPLPPVEGRQLFRCDTHRDDALLGRLVYCTEYDSDRIGSLPTPSQLAMSESMCGQSGGVWAQGPCRAGWRQRCVTRKGAAHFYYEFVAGAPETQCRQWKGTLTESP
ncbi:MAG: hypothetical protein F9K16_02925 [Thermoanaerobaculia bacterium]|nr:MAG: hypothetical protein F9K16_02925 [Thermoanaerobaculia bacterium]MBZ0100644.1 hypothetical protein [Thermoanaerobaculia bacterium]